MRRLPPLAPFALALAAAIAGLAACDRAAAPSSGDKAAVAAPAATESYAAQHLGDYVSVPLKADLSAFDADDRKLLALLVQASQRMDGLYWKQEGLADAKKRLAEAQKQGA